MRYIHTLTGLRGLAALIVFVSHSANEYVLPPFIGLGFGQIGVMIFFVLSGFLMSHLYINDDFNYMNVKKYALARIARVFPLYFALIIISAVISSYFYKDFCFKFDDISTILRAFAFIDAPEVFWTIPVEVQFYVAFVGFWFLYKKNVSPYILMAFVFLIILPTFFLHISVWELPNSVSPYSYAFFIGTVTSLFYHRIKCTLENNKILSAAGAPIMLLLFVNLPVLREHHGFVYSNLLYLRTWGDPISWILVYGLFICALFNSKSLAFLNWRPFVFMGDISYGFYLIHYPVLMYFKGYKIHHLMRFSLAFSVTAIIAYLSYKYFEKPVGNRIRSQSLKQA